MRSLRLDVLRAMRPSGAWRLEAAAPAARDATLAALSGVLYASAGPGLGLWPLAFVCWVPLLVALRQRTPRQAAWLGLLQGMASSLVATSWILSAVKTLSGWGLGLSLAAASLLWLY